jgi:hypothetical protein
MKGIVQETLACFAASVAITEFMLSSGLRIQAQPLVPATDSS